MNASHEEVAFRIPEAKGGSVWELIINTAVDPGFGLDDRIEPGAEFNAVARSLALLVRR